MERLESLQELCLSSSLLKLTSSLSITNVWSIRRHLMFPLYTNNNNIKFVIDTFICDHFLEISQTDQILLLDEGEMHWLIDNQDIKACEATMLHSLLRWYKHQEPHRERVFKDMFSKIHLSIIPREYLWSVIRSYDLVRIMPELIEYKVSKLEGFMKRLNMSDSLYQQNLSNIALIGWSYTGCIINCYMPLAPKQSERQISVQGVPIVSKPLAVVQFLNKILIFFLVSKPTVITYHANGRSHNRAQRHSIKMCLELNKNCFPQFSLCPDFVNHCALTISCGMFVFFLGGDECSSPFDEINEVYRYDALNDEWKQMASMIHARSTTFKKSIAIASSNNRYIFVFGPKHSEKYDIYTNKWSAIQSTPVEISILDTGHTINDKFYIFGKRRVWEMNVRCFIYDPIFDTWQSDRIESLPFFCVTNSFLGKNFFSHREYDFEDLSKMPNQSQSNIFTFSELDLENRKKKKLISLSRRKLDWNESPVFMILLSRRARMFMEYNQTLAYTIDI